MFEKVRSAHAKRTIWLLTLSLVCALYFVTVVITVLKSRESNFSTAGVTEITVGPQLIAGQKIRYTFPKFVKQIDDLVLFVEPSSYRTNLETPLSMELRGSNSETRDIVVGTPAEGYRTRHGNVVALIFDNVNVSKKSDLNLELTLSIPQDDGNTGIHFYGTRRFIHEDVLTLGDAIVPGIHLMVQTHYLDYSRLLGLIVTGWILLLIACVVTYKNRFHLGWSFLVAVGLAVALSELGWQAKLDEFYGWFWPDRYVEYATVLQQWFKGDLAWEKLVGYTATFRNAQAWMVPASIATLSIFGLSYVLSYTMLNIVAYTGVVGVWTLLFNRNFPDAQTFDKVLFMVAVSLHYLHLSVGTSLLTDSLTCFFVGLFFLLFSPIIDNSSDARVTFSWPAILLPALALYLSLQTRIAMIPLVIAPIALLAWLPVRDRFLQDVFETDHLAPIAATVGLAIILSLLTYTIFGLYDSILIAKSFAEQFSLNNFSPGFFVANANDLLIPAYAAILLGRSTTFTNNVYSLIWIFVLGYLFMLYLGQIPTWSRYLAPLAAPIVFYSLSIAMENSGSKHLSLYRVFALLLIGYHVYKFLSTEAIRVIV